MGVQDGPGRKLQNFAHGWARDVRDVDDHAEPVHFLHDLPAELGEAGAGRVQLAGANAIIESPGKQDVADTELVKRLQVLDPVLDELAALGAEQNANLPLLLRVEDIHRMANHGKVTRAFNGAHHTLVRPAGDGKPAVKLGDRPAIIPRIGRPSTGVEHSHQDLAGDLARAQCIDIFWRREMIVREEDDRIPVQAARSLFLVGG